MTTDEPMEVVVLNDHASLTGGSAAVAIASALGLAARGVRVTFFSAVGPIAPELVGVKNLNVICLGQQEIAKNPNRMQAFAGGLRNARAVHALRQVLADKPAGRTIVHAHGWMKALSPFALSAVSRLGFPLVVTLHDFFIACPTGGFFVHGSNALCERSPLSAACWRCNCDRRNYGHKLWRNARTVVQNGWLRVPQNVAHYLAVSDFSRKILQPYLPSGSRTTVLRNPVDCEQAQATPVNANRDFIFVGRFEAEKGVRLFAEAVRSTGAGAVFVGDGALGPELRALCPTARFTGWLDREGIRREVRQARALVFPPLWYETLGLVAIEAAAEGVPAIVSDRCAATDYVHHDVNGVHFTRGVVASLSSQITALRQDDARVARLGRAAYEWYWQRPWTRAQHVEDLLEVYREVTARAKLGEVPRETGPRAPVLGDAAELLEYESPRVVPRQGVVSGAASQACHPSGECRL